jgi:hypothetical protein
MPLMKLDGSRSGSPAVIPGTRVDVGRHQRGQHVIPGWTRARSARSVLRAGDARRALPRAEHIRMPAGLRHIRVLHQRVVARAFLGERRLRLREERRPLPGGSPQNAMSDRSIPATSTSHPTPEYQNGLWVPVQRHLTSS